MTGLLVTLVTVGAGLALAVLALRWRVNQRWAGDLVCFRLVFPRGLSGEAVTSFASGLSGLLMPWWWRWLAPGVIGWEVTSTPEGITHRLLVPPPLVERVLANLRATLRGVSVIEEPEHELVPVSQAAELTISTTERLLATEPVEAVSAGLLSALQPLSDGETVVVQWLLSPAPTPAPLKRPRPRRSRREGWQGLLQQAAEFDSEAFKAAQAKQAQPQVMATARLGVQAEEPRRAGQVLATTLAAFRRTSAPGVKLRRRHLPKGEVARRLRDRRLPLAAWPSLLLNSQELAGLLAVPIGEVSLPGLTLGGCRQLAPSAVIPRHGRVLGDSTFPGVNRPLAVSPLDRLRHAHLIGPTGSGKSWLLANLIGQDIAAGSGVVVLDPKGDLTHDVLDRVPAHRRDDVIVLDPAESDRPLGMNLLSGAGISRGLIAEQVVSVFAHLYEKNWGPRSDDILRSAVLTLLHQPGMTLAELPVLLTSAAFRQQLLARLDEPFLASFWQWYGGLKTGERNTAIGPVLNKTRAFLLRKRIRHLVGQADSSFSFEDVLAEGKVLVISLAKGLLGEEAANLLGSLLLMRLWQAVLGRAALPPEARPPLFVYVDEFSDYVGAAGTFGELLAQARGLGVGVTVAHQHLAQLPRELRAAVLANTRTRVVFQTSADDARLLAREFDPHLTPADLMGLGPYEVVMSLAVGAQTVPPVTGRTRPLPDPLGTAAEVRAQSAARYGRDRAEVEAAIRARQAPPTGGPVRRKRRGS